MYLWIPLIHSTEGICGFPQYPDHPRNQPGVTVIVQRVAMDLDHPRNHPGMTMIH